MQNEKFLLIVVGAILIVFLIFNKNVKEYMDTPTAPIAPTSQSALSATANVQSGGLPAWAIALIVIGIIICVAAGVTIAIILWKKYAVKRAGIEARALGMNGMLQNAQ